MMRLALVIFAACVACSGSAAKRPVIEPKPRAGSDPDGPNRAAVAAQVQPMIDAEMTTGLVVGLYDGSHLEIYGFGKGPDGKPPTGHTLFELGSATAIFTSLLLADAVQKHVVDLDAPVSELLPPGVTAPTADKIEITLRHLSVGSSGLPPLPRSLEHAPMSQFAKYNEDALYRDLVHAQLTATPGTMLRTSDFGTGLLGFLLGKKLQTGYAPAMRSLLDKAGLVDTVLPPLSKQVEARRAVGTTSELTPVPASDFGALAGAAGMLSDAADLLRLVDAELQVGTGAHSGILPQMKLTLEPQAEGEGSNVALGWNIDNVGRYWQSGGTPGFRTFIGFDPKNHRGIVLLSSSSTSLIDALAKRLYDVLAHQDVPAPKFADEKQIAQFAGTYAFEGTNVGIKAEGKRLYVVAPGEPRIRLLPVSDHEFWIDEQQVVVVFEQKDGKVTRAIFLQGEHQLSAPRVGE